MDKLSPEEMRTAVPIGKLTPDELAGAPRVSKYPVPRSMTADDVAQGTMSGPVALKPTGFLPSLGADPALASVRAGFRNAESPAEKAANATDVGQALRQTDDVKDLHDFARGLVAAGAAGVAGKLAGAAAPAIAKGGTALSKTAAEAISKTATHAIHGGTLGYLIGEHHGSPLAGVLTGMVAGPLLARVAKYTPTVGTAAANAASDVAPVAAAGGVAAGTIAATAPDDTPQARVHNALDRLRLTASANAKAADLVQKVDAIRNMQSPFGAVEQGMLGGGQ